MRRGDWQLVCNFAAQAATVPSEGGEVVLATHEARIVDGHVELPSLAGAVMK